MAKQETYQAYPSKLKNDLLNLGTIYPHECNVLRPEIVSSIFHLSVIIAISNASTKNIAFH
jgi:hypothetical protein